ncbi:MAG TPA: amino acid adenylation domain-containing protein [Candidatus Acidoferrales bacterium]|nr:amino acid adenylation domain-containing protein [Candidatus Acidoferrales bacterium]
MPFLLTQLLSDSSSRYAQKPAVCARGKSFTYRELEEQSNQLAHLLREHGLKSGDRVGLYLPKCVESVVCMFGVMKAGGVYVPLDPQQPAQRIAYIISNCSMKAVICTAEQLANLPAAQVQCLQFAVTANETTSNDGTISRIPWTELSEYPGAEAPDCPRVTTDLAYILYTSGSTGTPKGVMISHQNALTFVQWCADAFQVRSDDRLSNHAPLHFDLSVFDIYNAIEAGATVYLVTSDISLFPKSVANFIEKNGITIWYSVPSALILLMLHVDLKSHDLCKLRTVLFAGEVFPIKYVRQLAELLPQADLWNLYGPTETNVCTYYKVERAGLPAMDRLPIGKACANTEVFAVDEQEELAQAGQPGELYVRGPGVTCGYWGDTEKTKRSLVPNRFQQDFEEKAYRTGDIVTRMPDGNYDFMGRRDSMVKSRGYRIELGEIEAAILSHESIREAAAVAIPDDEVGARIKAFVATHEGHTLTSAEIQKYCAARIPQYMIPEQIELRENLPKTSTGKVDRVQLATSAKAAAAS